jgi:hypothetical protein
MAIIFGVPMSLTVCTLSTIPFVFGRFEFYLAMLYIFYTEYLLVIQDRFQFYKKHTKNMESGSLVPYCLIFQIFVTACLSFSVSVWIHVCATLRTQSPCLVQYLVRKMDVGDIPEMHVLSRCKHIFFDNNIC